jgi:hypothetical protein
MRNDSPSHVPRIVAALLLAGAAIAVACSSTPEPTADGLVREGVARMADLIDDTVDEEARAQRAKEVLADFQEDEGLYYERLVAHRDALRALNSNPDVARQDFDDLSAGFQHDREAFGARTVALVVDLKAELDADEWEQVFAGLESMDDYWQELAQ